MKICENMPNVKSAISRHNKTLLNPPTNTNEKTCKCINKKKTSAPRKALKDTHRENPVINKTQALTKSMNMDIWVIGTLNQQFIRGSYTEIKFPKIES